MLNLKAACPECGSSLPDDRDNRIYCSRKCSKTAATRKFREKLKMQPQAIHTSHMPNPTYSRWGFDAIYCFASRQNCDNCSLKAYGFSRYNCKVPEAIQNLQEQGIPVPRELSKDRAAIGIAAMGRL